VKTKEKYEQSQENKQSKKSVAPRDAKAWDKLDIVSYGFRATFY